MVAITIPPGVYNAPTPASKSAQWRETNLVRWIEDKLTPVGGWSQLVYDAPATRIRKIHRWIDTLGKEWTAYLCEGHLYVDIEGVLTDVSPVDPIVPPYDNLFAGGYGDFQYSLDEYGTPRPDKERDYVIAPCFTIDNWGEDLIVMTSVDGRLLRWKPSTPTAKAVEVPNAPKGRTFVVTPERFVIVFGADSTPQRFRWCDQENIENWNLADVASKAGEFYVEPASPIVSARRTRGGTIFHTTLGPYFITYAGMPYVYSYTALDGGSTPISEGAIIDTPRGAIWLATGGFWLYNGSSVAPIPCPVWNWVREDINVTLSRYYAVAVHLEQTGEVWFFFVSREGKFNDKFVSYSYRDGWWSMGKLCRACGLSSTYTNSPIMSDGFKIFRHDYGTQYPDAPEMPWAETFAINLGGGAGVSTVTQMVPDIGNDVGSVDFVLYSSLQRSSMNSPAPEIKSQPRPVRPDGYVDFRQTGRDHRLRIQSRDNGVPNWTFGNCELTIVGRGTR
ncbi:virion structural protein [Ochrobactrum phage vB_OspP_OH]|uniref:Tail protein n=1 Tax=Ochrobactrum phage vB_OspP_OH TaxID=2712957 RepID=A0A6G6XY03_9CAUD|nr:virion structural protein [Ochrobactrum phage vB_OspP_OH]QIG66099.1 tail protein [Ochrobactrum phage vB_OspP_OH]